MRSNQLSFFFVFVVGFVGFAEAQTSFADRAKLIEDAKREGKIVFYMGASANDGNALKTAFEKKYPFLKMEYFRAGKDKLLGKYLTEVRQHLSSGRLPRQCLSFGHFAAEGFVGTLSVARAGRDSRNLARERRLMGAGRSQRYDHYLQYTPGQR
jgi:hypothetical protein